MVQIVEEGPWEGTLALVLEFGWHLPVLRCGTFQMVGCSISRGTTYIAGTYVGSHQWDSNFQNQSGTSMDVQDNSAVDGLCQSARFLKCDSTNEFSMSVIGLK